MNILTTEFTLLNLGHKFTPGQIEESIYRRNDIKEQHKENRIAARLNIKQMSQCTDI